MTKEDKINIDNFRRELELRKLLEEQKQAEYTEGFPLAELNVMSIEGLEQEINKILLKQKFIINYMKNRIINYMKNQIINIDTRRSWE